MRDHEAFFPPAQNCTIWRYLDFTKLISLLETRQLYFPRADQFEDPYEGAWSNEGVRQLRNSKDSPELPPNVVEQFIQMTGHHRKEMFISCWNASEYESAAMWKLYLQSAEGVAVLSTSDRLASVMDACSYKGGISMVQYVDYDKTVIPFGNLFFPFVHKRLSFAHERELRAIIWSTDHINRPQIPEGAISVSIDFPVEELVTSVHVSPTAPTWFGRLVERVMQRYNLNVPVVRSNLYDRPTF